MIKDVMVRLDGTAADDIRLAALNGIADMFDSHVIGLYFNVLPLMIPEEGDSPGAMRAAELLRKAQEAGDLVERELHNRLMRLQKPVEIRRFDVLADAVADIAAREARAADTFVGLRPNGANAPQEPERLVEGILFGSGRHLMLVPPDKRHKATFKHILIAWNGSRESARALAESLPYCYKADTVTMAVVVDEKDVELAAKVGVDAANHHKHHGINAALHRIRRGNRQVGATLIAEAQECKADLIVMGGYGHSRLREWLLGGVTYELLHEAPVALLLAH
jgi:nucleotide-binding universal stress UspA family protein